jgi:dolichol-phosphate mannosyltransferase
VLLRKIPSRIANKIICHVTGVKLHDTGCSLKAYRREIIEGISLYGELHRFIPALARMNGATIEELAVNHRERRYGKSKYNLTRTFKVLMDISTLNLFLKYLHRPQVYFGATGLALIVTGLVTCLWLLFNRLTIGSNPSDENIVLTMTFLLMVTGFQFILYGLLSRLIVHTGPADPHVSPIRPGERH